MADLAMPRACVVCGRELLGAEKDICMECLADLPRTHFECMRCNPMADRFNERIEELWPDEDRGGYCFCTALFYYAGDNGYSQITQSLKYRRNFPAGRHFACMLGAVLKGSELYSDVDLIVPVPLHWRRRMSRGYNQAETIAASVAGTMGEVGTSRLLSRNRRTKSQAHLAVSAKAANVMGAFSVRQRELKKLRRTPSHVLLIDDVFTTGATLLACTIALRQVFGPEVRISVATLAFVGHP